MGRFETDWLTRSENLAALADLPGQWIDRVHRRYPPKIVVLDMDSSESAIYGEQEGGAYNGHFGCTYYHPLRTLLFRWRKAASVQIIALYQEQSGEFRIISLNRLLEPVTCRDTSPLLWISRNMSTWPSTLRSRFTSSTRADRFAWSMTSGSNRRM